MIKGDFAITLVPVSEITAGMSGYVRVSVVLVAVAHTVAHPYQEEVKNCMYGPKNE